MIDKEFNELWHALHNLKGLGVFSVIFEKGQEAKIIKGIEERYSEIITPSIYLHNIELVFV